MGTEKNLAIVASARRAGRPTLDQASALMDTILERTLDALRLRGSEGLSLDELAREIGVTKRTIYRHFDSKAGLIHQVVTKEILRLQQASLGASLPDASPLSALHHWAREFFFYKVDPRTLSFVTFLRFEAARDKDLAERIHDWQSMVVDHLLPLIVAAQEQDAIAATAPIRVAMLLFDLMGGPADRMGYHDDLRLVFGDESPEQYFAGRWAAFVRLATPDPWAMSFTGSFTGSFTASFTPPFTAGTAERR